MVAAEHATTKKQQQAEREEEHELYTWYHESSSSGGKPLGLERNLALNNDPAIDDKLNMDPPIDDKRLDTGPIVDANTAGLEFDDPFHHLDSESDLSVLLEGCTLPAQATSVQVKHDKPTTGNIADFAIDGDPSTW